MDTFLVRECCWCVFLLLNYLTSLKKKDTCLTLHLGRCILHSAAKQYCLKQGVQHNKSIWAGYSIRSIYITLLLDVLNTFLQKTCVAMCTVITAKLYLFDNYCWSFHSYLLFTRPSRQITQIRKHKGMILNAISMQTRVHGSYQMKCTMTKTLPATFMA